MDPFGLPDVAERYEDWYQSPYGQLADALERELLDELLGPLAPGATILEVGCGTGHFGSRLRSRAPAGVRVVGIDLSRAMLRHARERLPVALADAQRLPLADDSVDVVLIIAVLDFASDPTQVLREARRVARGHVAVLALVSHSALALRRRVSGRLGHPIFSVASFHSRARLLAFARAAGARVTLRRQILVLPPSVAARLPRVERRLSSWDLPAGGILGLRLEADADA